MTLDITLGNLLTILSIVVGFMWQHFYLVERIVKLEVKQQVLERDMNGLYKTIKDAFDKCPLAKEKTIFMEKGGG